MRGTSAKKQPVLQSMKCFILVVSGRGGLYQRLGCRRFSIWGVGDQGELGDDWATSPLPRRRSDQRMTQREPSENRPPHPTQHFAPPQSDLPPLALAPASTTQARHAILNSQCGYRVHKSQRLEMKFLVCRSVWCEFFCLQSGLFYALSVTSLLHHCLMDPWAASTGGLVTPVLRHCTGAMIFPQFRASST
jgi:hypothetical protein